VLTVTCIAGQTYSLKKSFSKVTDETIHSTSGFLPQKAMPFDETIKYKSKIYILLLNSIVSLEKIE
jgi:hypothetical protein